MSLTQSNGKVALVTGAAKRIGAVLAESLAADGWKVGLHCHQSRPAAEALAATITAKGQECFVISADLGRESDVASLIPTILGEHGRIDLLVNNASRFVYDSIDSVSWASVTEHFLPNLAAPLLLARDFARLGSGSDRSIVNLLDQKIDNLNPDFLSYTISKCALASVTKILAMALADQIRVNGIAPGITLRSGEQTDDSFAKAWRATPLGRSATPQEIALCLKFILASPSLTGQVIFLDGGESLTKRARDVAFDETIL